MTISCAAAGAECMVSRWVLPLRESRYERRMEKHEQNNSRDVSFETHLMTASTNDRRMYILWQLINRSNFYYFHTFATDKQI